MYRCGRQTEALRSFERARNFLAEEIGVDPSPELRELEQRILDHDPALGLPVTPSVTERVVMAVEVADPATLMRLDPAERTAQVQAMSEAIAASVERHRGEGFAQRGAAMYAAFASVDDAIAAVNEVIVAPGPTRPRIALDRGDVEIHESGRCHRASGAANRRAHRRRAPGPGVVVG